METQNKEAKIESLENLESVKDLEGMVEYSTYKQEELLPIYPVDSLQNSYNSPCSGTSNGTISEPTNPNNHKIIDTIEASPHKNLPEIPQIDTDKIPSMKVSFHQNDNKSNYLSQQPRRRKPKKDFNLTTTLHNTVTSAIPKKKFNSTITSGEFGRRRGKKICSKSSSTKVSFRRNRRKSQQTSWTKSRNRHKSVKSSKKRMFVESSKNSVLNKLAPKKSYWAPTEITLVHQNLKKKDLVQESEENLEILRKMNKLKFELRDKQGKLQKLKEK